MTAIFMSSRQFKAIPNEIVPDSLISIVDLSFNAIPQVPKEFFKCLPSLAILDLRGNSLVRVPDSVGLLYNLKILLLGSNKIQTVNSSDILGLNALETLDLCANQKCRLSEDVFSISSRLLLKLDLSFMRLESCPPSISFSTSLQTLNLSNNCLKALPESFRMLHTLVMLDLSHNSINQLPATLFSHFHRLKTLLLNNNRLVQLPEISDLISLEHLDVRYNCITHLPESMWKLSNLETLNVISTDCSVKFQSNACFDWPGVMKVHQNPIEYPPKDILTRPLHLILQYMRETPPSYIKSTAQASLAGIYPADTVLIGQFSGLSGDDVVSRVMQAPLMIQPTRAQILCQYILQECVKQPTNSNSKIQPQLIIEKWLKQVQTNLTKNSHVTLHQCIEDLACAVYMQEVLALKQSELRLDLSGLNDLSKVLFYMVVRFGRSQLEALVSKSSQTPTKHYCKILKNELMQCVDGLVLLLRRYSSLQETSEKVGSKLIAFSDKIMGKLNE